MSTGLGSQEHGVLVDAVLETTRLQRLQHAGVVDLALRNQTPLAQPRRDQLPQNRRLPAIYRLAPDSSSEPVVTGELARENAMRNPRRTSATAAALMVGVSLVGAMTCFAASGKWSVQTSFDNEYRGDLVVDFAGNGAHFLAIFIERLLHLIDEAVKTVTRFNLVALGRVLG